MHQITPSLPKKENTKNTIKTIKQLLTEHYPARPESKKDFSFEEYSERFNMFLDRNIPPRFKGSEITYPEISTFLSSFDYTRGLYIYGECGVGKTRNLYGIYRIFLANWQFDKDLPEVRFTNITDFFSDLKQSFDDPNSEAEIVKKIKTKDILFIDDFGAEKISEWTVEASYRLINYRYEWMLPTFFSSNLSLGKLAENIGDRFSSRIAEMCRLIELQGDDRRLK